MVNGKAAFEVTDLKHSCDLPAFSTTTMCNHLKYDRESPRRDKTTTIGDICDRGGKRKNSFFKSALSVFYRELLHILAVVCISRAVHGIFDRISSTEKLWIVF